MRTVSGRRQLLPSTLNDWQRFTALVNTPVQGGAADGLKIAMVELAHRLPSGAKLVLTVHDEIVLLCATELAEQVKDLLERVMTESMARLFPRTRMKVEAKICRHWGMKEAPQDKKVPDQGLALRVEQARDREFLEPDGPNQQARHTGLM